MTTKETLLSYLDLVDGWNGPGSKAPDKDEISRALDVFNSTKIDIHSEIDYYGSICLYASTEKYYLSIYFSEEYETYYVSVFASDRKGKEYFEEYIPDEEFELEKILLEIGAC